METMLNRFTQYALPFHLDVINKHRDNIEKVNVMSEERAPSYSPLFSRHIVQLFQPAQ